MTEHLANQTLIDYMHAGLGPEQDAHVYAHISNESFMTSARVT